MSKNISIIVPVLNEAGQMQRLLNNLGELCENGCEIILVDGGSSDGCLQMAQSQGFTAITSPPGRARQMNAGARQASRPILLFLHADCILPGGAAGLVDHALACHGQWGRFDVRISGRSAMFKVISAMMNLRSRLTGIATGDQAIFVRKSVFFQIGGFPDQPLMEDIELSLRLKRQSPPVCLAARVETSGRRWEERGMFATIWLMWRLRFQYWRGISADRLAQAYR